MKKETAELILNARFMLRSDLKRYKEKLIDKGIMEKVKNNNGFYSILGI